LLDESHHALDHVNEPLEEYPQVQSVEKASHQPPLVLDGVVEALLYYIGQCVKLVAYLVLLEAQFAPPLVILAV